MPKKIIQRLDRNLARRLREARRETGLSSRAIAARMPARLAVSHATITSYENGVTTPPIDVLAALAELYKRPLNWFLENREAIEGFRYRNLGARVPLSDRRQFEALAGKWAEAYFRLERHLGTREVLVRPDFDAANISPEGLATSVRQQLLNLDDNQPVQNTVLLLESLSAWALELRASFGVDGAAARHGAQSVVVLNPAVSNERVRMNVAHELAYLLYTDAQADLGWNEREVEKKAYVFASSLLLPDSQLREAFKGKSFLKLIQYKEKFGVSLAAMIYMAEQNKIINTTTSRWLWSQMTVRGWRAHEPGYVWRDRAIAFETMLEEAIQTRTLTWADAERITGIREADLRQRIAEAMLAGDGGLDDSEPAILQLAAGV